MNLQDCQKQITEALHPKSETADFELACQLLVNNKHMPSSERLLVYRHNISGGYINALSATYTTCESILGKACFATIARDYAWDINHQYSDMNQLADAFPEYLFFVLQEHEAFTEYHYLSELANLELAIEKSAQATDNSDANLLDSDSMLNGDPEQLYAVTNKSLRLISSEYPLVEIWQAHQQGQAIEQFNAHNDKLHICICRDMFDDVNIGYVEPELYPVLTSVLRGHSLGNIASNDPEGRLEAINTLIRYGWITGFRMRTPGGDK